MSESPDKEPATAVSLTRALLEIIRTLTVELAPERSRIPFAVQGIENLSADRRCVIAVNHASYLDGGCTSPVKAG